MKTVELRLSVRLSVSQQVHKRLRNIRLHKGPRPLQQQKLRKEQQGRTRLCESETYIAQRSILGLYRFKV